MGFRRVGSGGDRRLGGEFLASSRSCLQRGLGYQYARGRLAYERISFLLGGIF